METIIWIDWMWLSSFRWVSSLGLLRSCWVTARKNLRSPEISIIAERRRNSVASVVPEAGLFRKCNARTAKPCYLGHVLRGNERGVIIGACVSEAGPEPSAS
jgi:hypothetical protein